MSDNTPRFIERTKAESLARAILLFHRGGAWTDDDRDLWQHYTGSADATTKALCDLAREVQAEEERYSPRLIDRARLLDELRHLKTPSEWDEAPGLELIDRMLLKHGHDIARDVISVVIRLVESGR